jgi:excisionase family DNA binding protein
MVSYENLEEMLTVPQVAQMLSVHPNTLRRWSDRGWIRSFKVSTRGDRRYYKQDVNRFLDERSGQIYPEPQTAKYSAPVHD